MTSFTGSSSRARSRVLPLAILIVGIVSAFALLDRSIASPASSPLYPPGNEALLFSHARHGARAIECVRCHATAASSRSAVDLLLPGEAACRSCHAIDRSAANTASCGKCHRGFRPEVSVLRVVATPPALKFSHAAHAEVTCQRCHRSVTPPMGAMPGSDTIELPSMQSCLDCHRDGAQASRCTTCHLAAPSGRIDTGLLPSSGGEHLLRPTSTLFGDAHGPGFATDHRAAAARSDRTCSACHDESECADCHASSIRPMAFHPGDYLQVHAIAAKRASSECSTCHRYQSFCVGCHERVGVGVRAGSEWTGGAGALSFHPEGWASASGGGNLHAREARRNLPTCASCHREDDCLSCHSADAGGMRITPHPAGWRGSSQCRALDRGNRRMCLRCHVSAEELGCDWAVAR